MLFLRYASECKKIDASEKNFMIRCREGIGYIHVFYLSLNVCCVFRA